MLTPRLGHAWPRLKRLDGLRARLMMGSPGTERSGGREIPTMTVSSVVAVDAVAEFRTRLRGDILEMADAGYDEARKVWNGMIDKRPAVIARCAGVADVIEA